MRRLSSIVLAGALAFVVPAGAQPNAFTALRQALGGEAALSAISSIHATGKITVPGSRDRGHVEMWYQNPDKFVRLTRMPIDSRPTDSEGRLLSTGRLADRDSPSINRMWPDLNAGGGVISSRYGFDGETPITPGHGVGPLEAELSGGRNHYARFIIPLLGKTTDSYRTRPHSTTDAVRYTGDDGKMWMLALDPASHLPVTLTWFQVSRIAGQLDYSQTFRDFRQVGGVKWPHRFVITVSGETIEEVQIGKYEINTNISPKVFKQ
jgi:hypothetical protein